MNLRLTLYLVPFSHLRISQSMLFTSSVEINFLVYESPRDRVCVSYSLTNSAKVSVSTFLSFFSSFRRERINENIGNNQSGNRTKSIFNVDHESLPVISDIMRYEKCFPRYNLIRGNITLYVAHFSTINIL